MKTLKAVMVFIFIVLLIASVIWIGYWIRRKINYGLMYKGLVKETITEMVRPEALKKPKE